MVLNENLGSGSSSLMDIKLHNNDLLVYVEHLKHLCIDMKDWFSNLVEMNISGGMVDPFRDK